MRKWKKLRQIAASAMAAVMMVTAMPVGGVVYGDVVSGEEILGAEETDEILASGSNCEYGKVSDSDAVEAKVMAADPGVMLLAETNISDKIYIKGLPDEVNLGVNQIYNGNNYTITNQGNNEFKLRLNVFSGDKIQITDGVWEIEVNGTNTLNTSGHVLLIEDDVPEVTITGNGALNLNSSGTGSGIAIGDEAALIIDGAVTINATASDENGEGIDIGEGSTMTVKSRKVTARQNGAHGQGIYIREGGTLDVQGGNIDTGGNFTGLYSVGGYISVSEGKIETNSIVVGNESKSTIEITGSGEIDTGSIEVNNGTIEINGENAKIASTGNITVNNNSQIILNKGTLSLGGIYSGNKLVYNGGEIRGNGTFHENSKMDTEITCDSENPQINYQESVEVAQYFNIPDNRTVKYSMNVEGIEESECGTAELSGSTLSVSKAGKFNITAAVEANNFYAAASKTITLEVRKASLTGITVTSYTGTYDGIAHDAVSVKNLPEGTIIKYRKKGDTSYQEECPQVKDCADSGNVYEVEISGENYETQTYTTGAVSIAPANLSNASVSLEGASFVYDGTRQVPTVVAAFGEDPVKIPETYYTVSYSKDNIEVADPTDAGTYTVVLTATGVSDNNFTGTNESQTFTITPKALTPVLTGELTRSYNGTTSIDPAQDLKIILEDGEQEVSTVTASAASILYDSADAGERIITATGIQITGGEGQNNYKLGETEASVKGKITNAKMSNVNVEQIGELYYNGKPQSAITEVHADIPYFTSEEPVFTYLDPKDGEYKTSVPAFTNMGYYAIDFKASLKNYDDVYDRFNIRILPGDLSGAQITMIPEQAVYNGKEQTPIVKVKLGDVVLPEKDYEVLIRQGNKIVTPQAVGTYTVVVGGMNNMSGSGIQATFTITEKSIASDDVTINLSNAEFIYNSEIQQPAVTVTDHTRNTELILGTDYTVEIPEAVEAADSYKITVTGIGNYSGTKDTYYQIKQADLNDAEIEISGEYIYNGKGQITDMDHVRVTISDVEVPSNAYMMVCSNNVVAGSNAVLEIRATGVGAGANYTGSKTANFAIKPAKLTISDVVLKNKVYDGTETAEVESVAFAGLVENDVIDLDDCANVSAKFTDVNAGTGKQAEVSLELKAGETTKNYELPDGTFLLAGQTIEKAKAPVLDDIKVSYSIRATGTKTVDITGLPDDIGTYFGAAAEISSDAIHALGNRVTVDGTKVTFELLGNKKENIGKTSEILVKNIKTQNYEDAVLKILVTMDPAPNVTTSTSDSDDETSTAAGSSDNETITNDTVKGVVSSVNGIITDATNSTAHDGYSHWMKDENGWWLRYNDGSYPKGTKSSGSTSDTSYGWEQINGAWWAFDENGYMRSGWVLDAAFGGWFYVDEDHGMQTGWFFINGKWYYLNPVSDGRRGIMYAGTKTPDGWYVGEDGSWDGLAK